MFAFHSGFSMKKEKIWLCDNAGPITGVVIPGTWVGRLVMNSLD